MSDTDDRKGSKREERPMLILGENLPDVEDTTPEELRRQEEQTRREIERQRREAQEEIARKRREAEREIAELEARKARELKERERELERTQRKLYQRESRLLRQLPRSGSTRKRLVKRPRQVPLTERGLRRSGRAVLLGIGAALAITLGATTGGTSSDSELRAQVSDADEARVQWLRSGLETDEAIALRLAGRDAEVATGADGTYENVRLAQEAAALAPDSARYAERAAAGTEQMLDPATGPVRALTIWGDLHDESGYAVGSWEIEDLVEEAGGPSGWTVVLMVAAVLALVVLAGLALAARAWVSLPLLVVAAALAVITTVLVAGDGGAVADAARTHEEADDRLDEIHDQLGRDLQTAFGTSRSSLADDEDYWTRDPFYGEGPAALEEYLAVRTTVGKTLEQGDTAVAGTALDLIEAARTAFEAQVPPVEQARAELVRSLEGSRSARGAAVLLAFGSAALAGGAVLLSRGRERDG